MPSESNTFDLVVIGAGPGGYTAAICAARAGMSCALVESEANLGGVCLNWGCIPTKSLLRAAEVYGLVREADEFGLQVQGVDADWDRVMARSRRVPDELAAGVAGLMAKHQVTVFRGAGRLSPTRHVEVRDAQGGVQATLSATHILLATGGRPRDLPGVEIDGDRVWSSRHALEAASCPESLGIVGAGPVGVEFACFFAAFGCQVTLIEAADQVLPNEDPEIARTLEKALVDQGIDVLLGAQVAAASPVDAAEPDSDVPGSPGVRLDLGRGVGPASQGSGPAAPGAAPDQVPDAVTAERALIAAGVTGNTEGLGLEALGIRPQGGAVPVDECFRTSVPGVYAVGDLIGPPQLAHAAAAEARLAVAAMGGATRARQDRSRVPRCVYSQPQVASVGLTEAAAREQGEIRVGRFPFASSGLGRAVGTTQGLVKLVFGARYGELQGAAIVGPEATELIAELGLALALEATWEELADTVHAHPTLSEAVMEAAAAAFDRAVNI